MCNGAKGYEPMGEHEWDVEHAFENSEHSQDQACKRSSYSPRLAVFRLVGAGCF